MITCPWYQYDDGFGFCKGCLDLCLPGRGQEQDCRELCPKYHTTTTTPQTTAEKALSVVTTLVPAPASTWGSSYIIAIMVLIAVLMVSGCVGFTFWRVKRRRKRSRRYVRDPATGDVSLRLAMLGDKPLDRENQLEADLDLEQGEGLEPQPQPQLQPEIQPQPQPEIQPQRQPEIQPQPQPEIQPDPDRELAQTDPDTGLSEAVQEEGDQGDQAHIIMYGPHRQETIRYI